MDFVVSHMNHYPQITKTVHILLKKLITAKKKEKKVGYKNSSKANYAVFEEPLLVIIMRNMCRIAGYTFISVGN